MKKVFESYASFYDALYREKDYNAECDFLEEVFKKYSAPVKSILDVGCGTGGHSLLLAERGYDVSGVDLSSHMLSIAKAKANEKGLNLKLKEGDARDFKFDEKFDAVVSMFAVMGYQVTNGDIDNAFKRVREHLKPGGLFVFDVWFGPAVLTDRPSDKVLIIDNGDEKIIRMTRPKLNVMNHTVDVNFTVMRTKGSTIIENTEETHPMRFFFPQELEYFLNNNNMKILDISPFLRLDEEVTLESWNISVVAKAE